jgi:hypothetical protein
MTVDGHERLAEREEQHDRGGLHTDPVDAGEPVASLAWRQVAEPLERVAARGLP